MTAFSTAHARVGHAEPTYFIADISANHDGDLSRARALIQLAAEAGSNAAKFQNFRATQIVSAHGFATLGGQLSHQSTWKKSVIEVYEAASLPWEWTEILKDECDRVGIDYFSTPYDLAAVDMLDPYVDMFKVGSGDITWFEMIEAVVAKRKPVLLATGASDTAEVQRAAAIIEQAGLPLVLMQCNTNYTGSLENFNHIHLNVLRAYEVMFPNTILGLSDHTPGHATVLGAVALGARVIEKHFTDDTRRDGPDHPFSMTPQTWREMVDRTRELERALGGAVKRVADNERGTVVVQRRCVRAAVDLAPGTTLTRTHLEVLRPAPADAIMADRLPEVIGRTLRDPIAAGAHLRWSMLAE
jgi:N-acetylneuraminate synthase